MGHGASNKMKEKRESKGLLEDDLTSKNMNEGEMKVSYLSMSLYFGKWRISIFKFEKFVSRSFSLIFGFC